MIKSVTSICICLLVCMHAYSQVIIDESLLQKEAGRYSQKISVHAARINEKMEKTAGKLLDLVRRMEGEYIKALNVADTVERLRIMQESSQFLEKLKGIVENPQSASLDRWYSGYVDSVQTIFKFLTKTTSFGSPEVVNGFKKVIGQYNSIQSKINVSREMSGLLAIRQSTIGERLKSVGLIKEWRKYQSKVFYVRKEIEELKETLHDQYKLERKIINTAGQIPQFQQFFNRFSQQAGLFASPAPLDAGALDSDIAGEVQSISVLKKTIESRTGSKSEIADKLKEQNGGGDQLNDLKNRVLRLGQSGAAVDIPSFQPDPNKTKAFRKRIEFGFGMQDTESRGILPSMKTFTLNLGYKARKNLIVGIGGNYLTGFPRNIRHFSVTHEGVGFKGFVEWKSSRVFWLTASGEFNHLSRFSSYAELKMASAWQKNVLIGIVKKVRAGKNVTANFSLLFNCLYKANPVHMQPLVFRFNYTLK